MRGTQIANEDDVVMALRGGPMPVDVELVDLAPIPFSDQVARMVNVDVLVRVPPSCSLVSPYHT